MSAFTGYLIAYCSYRTKGTCYEEIAVATYGHKMQIFTTICMMFCNIGFAAAYMVLFKTMMPYNLALVLKKDLPSWCDDSYWGQLFWCVLFTVSKALSPNENTGISFSCFIAKKAHCSQIYVSSISDDLHLYYACHCNRMPSRSRHKPNNLRWI